MAVSERPTPSSAPRREAVFSLHGGSVTGKLRRLPSAFFGTGEVFIDRDLEVVREQFRYTIDSALRADKQPTYMLQAFRVGSRIGLYARDICNRTPFRSRLARFGAEFSSDAFVRFHPDGSFSCRDWGAIFPLMAVIPGEAEDPQEVISAGAAALLIALANLRFGAITPIELGLLRRTCFSMRGFAAADAAALVGAIRSLR